MRITVSLILALALVPGLARAQENTNPCEENDHYRDFDFWVGEWDVYAEGSGDKAGENSIQYEEASCLIVERWTSVSGGTGQSYNYFDPATEKWRQVWVSQAAIIDYEGGLNDEGSMELRGTITYQRSGQTADFLGIWTLQEDGSVRQHFEQYDAENDEWTPWFTGIYRRK